MSVDETLANDTKRKIMQQREHKQLHNALRFITSKCKS